MLISTFTSTDWFQIAYPAFWFVVGLFIGNRRTPPHVTSTAAVSVVQVIQIRVPDRPRRSRRKQRRTARAESDDWGDVVLVLVGGVVMVVLLAYAYIQLREVLLAVASGLLSLALGVVGGIVRRRLFLGMFADDWRWAGAGILLLAAAAVAVGYFLLHPLAGPPEYSVLFEAYRAEGWSALSLDSNVMLFATQALGAGLLITASALLLWLAVGCAAKGALVTGLTQAPLCVWLAGSARSPSSVLLLCSAVLLLLAAGFVTGTGYATRWAGINGAGDTPKLLVPRVAVTNKEIRLQGVATADGVLRLRATFRAHHARRPSGVQPLLRQWRMSRGRLSRSQHVTRARATRVVLTPARRGAGLGDVLRFRCGAARVCVRVSKE